MSAEHDYQDPEMMGITQLEKYQEEVEKIQRSMEGYLTVKGWVHTSDTPGHIWMWRKDVKKDEFPDNSVVGTILVTNSTAIEMQIRKDANNACFVEESE